MHNTTLTAGQLAVAFSFALEALIYSTPEIGWDEQDKREAKLVRAYPPEKWTRHTRMAVDRFAFFCQETRLDWPTREALWPLCFSFPPPWKARDLEGSEDE